MENKPEFIYTEEQLMARLKFFIGICLSLTLFGIVFATFLTGTLSGIMLAGTKPEDQKAMLDAQKLANENFEATKKAFNPPPRQERPEPSFGGSLNNSFGSPQPAPAAFTPQVVTGFGGKPMPVQPPQPEL